MTPEYGDQTAIERLFGRESQAVRLMAQVDWRRHPLGSPDNWPLALTVALRNMFASPESLYLCWGTEQSFFFNDAFLPLVEQRIDRAVGAPFAQLWSDIYPVLESYHRNALAGRGSRIVDLLISVPESGRPHDQWWAFSFAPIFDEHGVIWGVQGLTNETTEQVLKRDSERRSAAALAASEHRLRRAQEAGHVGVFSIDLATNIISGTAEFFRMFGLPQTDTTPATTVERIVLPEDQGIISHADGRRSEIIDLHVEYRIRRPDNGEIRYIERRAEFERDERGRPLRLLGVVQDVTERRADRAALADLNATLEARVRERTAERNLLARIVEETDNFVFVVDNDFRWLAFNRAAVDEFERVFGHRLKVGDPIDVALANLTDMKTAYDMWARSLAGEEFTALRELGDNARGESRTYELKFNVLRDEDGKQIGAFQVSTDITERLNAEAANRQMQERLRQSQKMEALGQLTGGVAHDFNNLLTPIIGSLDMIQQRSALTEREARLVDGALQSAERAKTLVQRLLAFARRQPLQAGPVEMARLVDGMAELVASTSGRRIVVKTDVPATLPPAHADHNQLEMAILNLCVNARDAMPDGGIITIAAQVETAPAPGVEDLHPGRYLRLSVIDTGTGMDEETLRRAIEPFYSTKGVGKGTGLGLSMVDGLVSQLGGSMKISSRPGVGTSVDLWLPISTGNAATSTAVTAPETVTLPDSRGRALVVDDEALVRMTTADMLKSLGYDAEEADSARTAERMLRAGLHFDLVVTDHLMPGKSGADLARTIRANWPELPVLIISGYAEAEAIAPDMPRLSKPFRGYDLAQAIKALVQPSRQPG